MRTMIVDDSFINRKVLQSMLSKFGVCDVATDGEEVLEAVERSFATNEPYDLICLDIMMPGMNGQEALRLIRDLEDHQKVSGRKRCRILMTTALNDKSTIMASFRENCDGYLVKPIRQEDLLAELKKVGLA